MTLNKSRTHIKIDRNEWEELKKNPVLRDTLELLEDISDIEKAKKDTGKSISLKKYLKKRGL